MSLKAKVARKNKYFFTDREPEVNLFKTLLQSPNPEYNILHFYGIGGVGKTTLVYEFFQTCKDNNTPFAVIEAENNNSVLDILTSLRKQFNNEDVFTNFDKQYKKYVQIKIAIDGFIQNFHSDTDQKLNICNFINKHFSDVAPELYLNAEDYLTKLIIIGLNQLAQHKKLVIAFDTYEQIGKLDIWLANTFLNKDIDENNIIFIISGKEELSDNWISWKGIVKSTELKIFARSDAIDFLTKCGFKDKKLIDMVLEDTSCLPLDLALEVDTDKLFENQTIDLSERERNRLKIIDRFMSHVHDSNLRSVIEICSLFRSFDEDILTYLIKDFPKSASDYLELLRKNFSSFVKMQVEGKYTLHDNVREYISEKVKKRSRSRYSEIHKLAVNFYEEIKDKKGIDQLEKRNAELNYLYHKISLNEEDGISEFSYIFDNAIMAYNIDYLKALLSTVSKLQLCKNSKNILQYCWGQFYFIQSIWNQALDNFLALSTKKKLPNYIRDNLSYFLGVSYKEVGQLEKAFDMLLKDVVARKSKADNKKLGRVLVELADTCWLLGKTDKTQFFYKEAVVVFKKTEHKSGLGRAYVGLEQLYRYIGRWDEAKSFINKALKIGEETDDIWLNGRALYGLTRLYSFMGKLKKAEETSQKSINFFKKIGFRVRIADSYAQIARIYAMIGDSNKADEMIKKGREIHQKIGARRDEGFGYYSQAIAYYNAGKLTKAMEYAKKCLCISEDTKYIYGIAMANIVLGDIFAEDNFEVAVKHYNEAFTALKIINSPRDLAYLHIRLGDVLRCMKKYNEAKRKYNEAKKILTNSSYYEMLSYWYVGMGQLQLSEGNVKKSFDLFGTSMTFAVRFHPYLLAKIFDRVIEFFNRNFSDQLLIEFISWFKKYWQQKNIDGQKCIEIESIRRAEESGLSITQPTLLEKIYQITHELSRKKTFKK